MSVPASMKSTDVALQHLQTVIFYQKSAIENLKPNLASYAIMEKQSIPMKSGKTMQFYENNIFGQNIVPVSEGTIPAPLSNGSTKGTVSLVQYADWMSFSDFLVETANTDVVREHAGELGFRAALSTDKMNYAAFDAAVTAMAAAAIDLGDNEYLTRLIGSRAVTSLLTAKVRPRSGGNFDGIMHTLQAYDYLNDNTAGGVMDILKRNDYGKIKAGMGSGYTVLTLDGIRWVCTTEVPTSTNFPSSGKTGYSAYVAGKDWIFATSLGGTKVPSERNFTAGIDKQGRDTGNPTGQISHTAYYNFKYATYTPPDAIPRFRRIRSETSVTS